MRELILNYLDTRAVFGLVLLVGGFILSLTYKWFLPTIAMIDDYKTLRDLRSLWNFITFYSDARPRDYIANWEGYAFLNPLHTLFFLISIICMAAGLYLSFPFFTSLASEWGRWFVYSE